MSEHDCGPRCERITFCAFMPWHHYAAYFFGGAACANCLPHLLAGVAGRPMQTPFASPPFRGLSSPIVNVAWGLFNLVIAYVLLAHVGDFDIRSWSTAGVTFLGFAAMALQCARSLGRMNRAGTDGAT